MDLESLRVFVKVAELASFTRAGEHLRVPKSRVSARVSALEASLGCRLLRRSTRVVQLTPDGETLLERARRLVQEADEVATMFHPSRALRGVVRLDMPVSLARDAVIPRLPELLANHPHLEVFVGSTDRLVEPTREGFDCVLRVGAAGDSGLMSRRLGALAMVNVASPAYLRRHGTPLTLADLDGHVLVNYAADLGGGAATFEHREADRWVERPMRCAVTVNNADAFLAACVAGLGIIQTPRIGARASLAAGRLEELLPAFTARALPVTLMHTHGRSVPRRVRAVMAWLAEVLGPHIAPHGPSPQGST